MPCIVSCGRIPSLNMNKLVQTKLILIQLKLKSALPNRIPNVSVVLYHHVRTSYMERSIVSLQIFTFYISWQQNVRCVRIECCLLTWKLLTYEYKLDGAHWPIFMKFIDTKQSENYEFTRWQWEIKWFGFSLIGKANIDLFTFSISWWVCNSGVGLSLAHTNMPQTLSK